MKKYFSILACLITNVCYGAVTDLDSALRATYTACVDIDDELADMKKMAGINTAVTAVGTATGVGATVVGIVKAKKDSDAKTKFDNYMNNVPVQIIDKSNVDDFFTSWESYEWSGDDANEFNKLRKQSKTLGNWRTGLMAGNTVTNVAGAIIAGNNKVDQDLQTRIDNCKSSVKDLRDSIMQARMDGVDITEAEQIASACGEYEYIDISQINKRAKGAMISSIVGVGTGVAGTVTSAVANSESVRKDNEAKEGKKTEADWDREKNINTAANVLAGTSTVASGVATVFNATQISAIKKVAAVAEKCTGVLK